MQVFNDVEAAKFLGLKPQTLRNLRCYRKGPPYLKLGRAVRYLRADLEAYLARHRVVPEGQEKVVGGNE
ncbi:MAG: helix-turn-helix domain-containing protein [Deltaproteobacteria bacterium]|nr:helix-turn-helix domain-containing protein [Deltaproteobacteria bacterium]